VKGIILAGGHATRLHPTTKVVNKHHILIYDKPMIFYAVETLRDAGITDIIITLGDHDNDRFFELLGHGQDFGVNIDYHFHGKPLGISHAIWMCRDRVGDEPFVVLLGDNIFCDGLQMQVNAFKDLPKPMMVLKKMPWAKARNYGVALIEDDVVVDIVEKPKRKVSQLAVLGVYFLDKTFFEVYKRLNPSGRGEYEITDALKLMNPDWSMYGGLWFDCGTFDDIYQASTWRRNQSLTGKAKMDE